MQCSRHIRGCWPATRWKAFLSHRNRLSYSGSNLTKSLSNQVGSVSLRASPRWTEQPRKYNDYASKPDTIYALSTAPGRAAIAVIRVSGSACVNIHKALCPGRPLPNPRLATLRKLIDPESSHENLNTLDSGALVLYFPGPNTVTGEDILELHVHGGPALVRSVLNALSKCSPTVEGQLKHGMNSIRHAEPGEFTKRAFYNGRLDLTQAEALGDILSAETEQQRRIAVRGTDSGLSDRYEEWRTMLLYARGELEALIDFSEDQHFDESPVEFMSSVTLQVVALKKQIEGHIKNAVKGELLRNGIDIALLGAPNAGKSSLLNQIVGREAAIVSAEEGTTRDIVDVSIDISGWLCKLGDMAGLRTNVAGASSNLKEIGAVEREGIRRARQRALNADVVIVLLALDIESGKAAISVNEEVIESVKECQVAGKTIIVALNKVDLFADTTVAALPTSNLFDEVHTMFPDIPNDRIFLISCRDALNSTAGNTADPGGFQQFLHGLTRVFEEMTTTLPCGTDSGLSTADIQSYWNASLAVTHRQSAYLQECLAHLDDFLAQVQPSARVSDLTSPNPKTSTSDVSIDIVTSAEHLRYAANCLAKITGRGEGGDVEDVLGVVFEK